MIRIIAPVSTMAECMRGDISDCPELFELKQDVVPEQVLDRIEEIKEQFTSDVEYPVDRMNRFKDRHLSVPRES